MVQVTASVESLRQVDRIKATVVGKSYPLTLTKDYVSKWGLVEAVRELIQNALDSTSPFVYSWEKEDDESWTLMLNSELSVLSPQTLLLGATNKGQDPNAIGSFGEGYKLALLVLCRLGMIVDMLNGDVLWRPTFRYNRNFDAELLTIDESFLQEKGNKGLTFFVRGLSEADKDDVIQSCIRMQTSIGAIKQTDYGDILLDQKGRLYVGGLFICTTELHYGYNVKPQHIVLERDRKTIDSWDLQVLTTKMWYDTKEIEFVAEMISKEVPDVEHARYDAPEFIREECYKIFRKRHPNALLADSAQEARDAIKGGLVEKVYEGARNFHSVVSGSESYKSYAGSYTGHSNWAPPTPYEEMAGFDREYKNSMTQECQEALSKIVERSKNWRLMP